MESSRDDVSCPYPLPAGLVWLADYLTSREGNPDMVNEWTREDLPEVPALRQADDERGTGNRSTAFDIALDVVVEHLNRHFPKVPPVLVMPDSERPESDAALWRRAHSIAEAERDQAREQRDLWKERAKDAACDRADAERSEAAMERQRDEAHQACGLFQRDVHDWRSRAEAAEARTAPAVTREQVEKAVRSCPALGAWNGTRVETRAAIDAVCDLLGIEAGQDVDPLLDKAQEFAALADWELTDREAELLHTVAAHVLGQEAGDE